MADPQQIVAQLKDYILEEFLPGEDPDELQPDTELMSSGVLDSLATLKIVTFLEDTYGIQVQPHEADEAHMNTLADIAALVASKG